MPRAHCKILVHSRAGFAAGIAGLPLHDLNLVCLVGGYQARGCTCLDRCIALDSMLDPRTRILLLMIYYKFAFQIRWCLLRRRRRSIVVL